MKTQRSKLNPIIIVIMITVICLTGVCAQNIIKDDTLRILIWQSPDPVWPYHSKTYKDLEVFRIVYEPLASFDVEGKLVPVLAARIPTRENGGLAADGKSVTWKLKQGVHWADGAPLTVDDVIFTYERIMSSSPLFVQMTGRLRQTLSDLQENKEWLQTTLRSIGDAVIATDTRGKLSFMNPVAEFLTGWNQGESIGKPLEDVFNIINEKTRAPVENPVKKVIREGSVVGLANHTLLIGRDGTEIPVDDSGAPIMDEQGEMRGVVLIFRDVGEKRRAEEALKESEEKVNTLLNATTDAALLIEPDGAIVAINDAAAKSLGGEQEEMIGKCLWKFVSEEIADRRKVIAQDLFKGKKPLRIEDELKGKYFDNSLYPVFDKNGNVQLCAVFSQNITKRKKAEKMLKKYSEELK